MLTNGDEAWDSRYGGLAARSGTRSLCGSGARSQSAQDHGQLLCRYEERYYVWTPGETWRVRGRLKPGHGDKRIVLQGRTWRTWKTTRSHHDGRYRFQGVARNRAAGWWVNLRVVMRAQDGHKRAVSKSMYIDMNPATRCR